MTMNRPGGGHKRKAGRNGKRMADAEMIPLLTDRIAAETPASGTNPLADRMSTDVPKRFDQLPVSDRTLQGLKKGGYESMKDIQTACIPHLLAGRDLMGAAKTGSGKTLAFLVPAMEKLYRQNWNSLDGLGALIISPTRELAIQIFDVLKKVGSFHEMSAGLIIGGKDVAQEQERVTRMNMLVCTPGRLLQHMDETYGFECSAVQILVLDEADRILDMGFSATLNSIIQNLPRERQTVLFSATLSKSVKDLARLSLRAPEYIAVHEAATYQTPTRLQQHYMVMDSSEKLDALWSFIKTHLKQKTIVFFSSCNQVKFVHEAFCRMRPGIVLSALHGKVKQEKRLQIFMDFCSRKEAVLLATDVAGRGLDFPEVDWVIQVDCPEDVATYIHRVGRTARNESKGKSLLLLTESELHMAQLIQEARVPIKKIQMNKSKSQPLQQKLVQQIAQDPALKHMAQKAFVSYLRSVHLQSNKQVFDVTKYSPESIAGSWGLATLPRLRFVDAPAQKMKNVPYALRESMAENGDMVGLASREGAASARREGGEDEEGRAAGQGRAQKQRGMKVREKEESAGGHGSEAQAAGDTGTVSAGHRRAIATTMPQSKMTKLFNRKNNDVLSETYRKLQEGDDSSDEEIFKVATQPRQMDDESGAAGRRGVEPPEEKAESESESESEGRRSHAKKGGGEGREQAFEKPRVSKRSMRKIKVNGGNGTRMVFDEDTGEALNPLVQLMRSGLGHEYVEGKGEGITPQMHAAAIKQRIARSDVADKDEFRKRQKENKLQLKIKLKRMMREADDEDDEARRADGARGDSDSADESMPSGGEEHDSPEAAGGEGDGRAKSRSSTFGAAGSSDRKKRPRPDTYDLAAHEDMALEMIMKRRK